MKTTANKNNSDNAGITTQDEWVEALIIIAEHYQINCSRENVRLASVWADNPAKAITTAARQAGLALRFLAVDNLRLSQWRLPMMLEMDDGLVGVIEAISAEGEVAIRWVSDQGLASHYPFSEIQKNIVRLASIKPLAGLKDARIDTYISPFEPHWLRHLIIKDWRPYGHVILASFAFNLLGLAGVLFSMQVYDRVIPAQSMPTLYVLFIGVMLASVFAFVLKIMRGYVMDILGKRADLRISDRVFGHAIRLKLSARPVSTGTFISQLRELEQVREMITSSTIGAMMDMPFFFVFLAFFALIAGPLVWVPIIALIIMIAPALLMQKRLAKFTQLSMRESSLRNGLLVESIQGMEDIKNLQAENRINAQWNRYNQATAESSMQQRHLTHLLLTWSQTVQASVFALVIFVGVPLVIDGDLTTGSLVAASILSTRMLAPMAQLTQVLTRWQHAKVAMQSLDELMKLPVDNPSDKKFIHKPVIGGDYVLQDAVFRYNKDSPPILQIKKLHIKAGERVAILGRNGAGKSSLLQALAGYTELVSGKILLDDLSLHQIDSADVRRDVGLLSQSARLFYGSLRENLTLGAPRATDAQIIQALEISGAINFVRHLTQGLDHLLMEGGSGLSGGQRQSLLLSRLILRDPNIVLLDEPTASLDDNTENTFINALDHWLGKKTLILATHRMAALKLVNRVIVVEGGQIVLDAPKEQALLSIGRPKA